MKTAACWRKDNSSSAGILSRMDGVDVNFSAGKIQLKRAFGNVEPGVPIVVIAGVGNDDDGCIMSSLLVCCNI